MQGVLWANPVCIPEDRVSPLAGVCLAWGKQTNQESRFQPLAVAQVPNLLFGNQEAALQLLLHLSLWENFCHRALTVCLSYGTYQCLLWGGREESPDQVAFKLARVTGLLSWQSSGRLCQKAELCPKRSLASFPFLRGFAFGSHCFCRGHPRAMAEGFPTSRHGGMGFAPPCRGEAARAWPLFLGRPFIINHCM